MLISPIKKIIFLTGLLTSCNLLAANYVDNNQTKKTAAIPTLNQIFIKKSLIQGSVDVHAGTMVIGHVTGGTANYTTGLAEFHTGSCAALGTPLGASIPLNTAGAGIPIPSTGSTTYFLNSNAIGTLALTASPGAITLATVLYLKLHNANSKETPDALAETGTPCICFDISCTGSACTGSTTSIAKPSDGTCTFPPA